MRKLLLTTVIALLSMTGAMAQQYDFTAVSDDNTLYYKITDAAAKTVAVVSELYYWDDGKSYNTAPTGSLTIPESVTYDGTTYSVTSIGDDAFNVCSGFTGSLTIPNSVTSIGANAFSWCSGFTGSLTIGNSVTSIGSYAFYNCSSFTGSLTIPNSVTSIGFEAFYDCKGFTGSLTIGNSVTSIGDNAFYDCNALSQVSVLATAPPALGWGNFSDAKVIYVPQGTRATYIATDGWKDFADKLHFIEIGNDTEVLSINVATAGTLWDELDAAGKHPTVVARLKLSGTLGTDDWALLKNNMTALYDLDLSEITNTTIPYEAFKDSKIIHFKFPQGLLSIGNSAFSNSHLCDSLELPNSVTSIGDYAFSNCSGFTGSLSIPNSVTSIGSSAFRYCRGFTGSLSIPNSLTSIGSLAFDECSGFTGKVLLPAGLTSVESRIFYGCSGINHVVIPAKVSSISTSAFASCYAIDTLTCLGVNPVELSSNFSTIDPATCILQVPTGARKNYASAVVWGNFINIQEIEVGAPSKLVKLRISEGGTVRYAGEVVANNYTLSIEENTTLTLSIAPQAGYGVKSIMLGSTDITSSYAEGTLTTPAIAENADLSISFEKISYAVELYVEGGTARYAVNVEYGASLSCNIAAEAGHTIESVTVNGSEVSLSAEGLLVLNNIQENKVVLVKTHSESTALRSAEAQAFTAWAAHQTIYVEVSTEMEQVRIVNLEGKVIYSNPVSAYEMLQVPMSQAGAYIIQAQMKNNTVQAVKVVLAN